MRYTLGKEEKLKSKILIEQLFKKGTRVKSFPLQLIYLPVILDSKFPIKVGFSVPKRNIKLAVDRNRIKRLMREVYRKNKYDFSENVSKQYAMMFIYMNKNEMKYEDIELSMKKLQTKLMNTIKNDE